MKEIQGNAKNLRSLLAGAKFAIDYYQREYRWETKQVKELIEDLAEKFGDHYKPGDPRREVKNYGHYFLGACAAERFCRRSVGSRNQSCCLDIRILLPDPRSGYSFALMVWCCPTRTFCGADS